MKMSNLANARIAEALSQSMRRASASSGPSIFTRAAAIAWLLPGRGRSTETGAPAPCPLNGASPLDGEGAAAPLIGPSAVRAGGWLVMQGKAVADLEPSETVGRAQFL